VLGRYRPRRARAVPDSIRSRRAPPPARRRSTDTPALAHQARNSSPGLGHTHRRGFARGVCGVGATARSEESRKEDAGALDGLRRRTSRWHELAAGKQRGAFSQRRKRISSLASDGSPVGQTHHIAPSLGRRQNGQDRALGGESPQGVARAATMPQGNGRFASAKRYGPTSVPRVRPTLAAAIARTVFPCDRPDPPLARCDRGIRGGRDREAQSPGRATSSGSG